MTDIPYRLQLKIDTQVNLTAAQYEGLPGIVSGTRYPLAWYAGGGWRYAALAGADGSVRAYEVYSNFSDIRINSVGEAYLTEITNFGASYLQAIYSGALTNYKLPVYSPAGLVDSCFGDDGTNATITQPLTVTGGKTTLDAATAGHASLNIPAVGVTPTSPAIGDIWASSVGLGIRGIGIEIYRGASDTIGKGSFVTLRDEIAYTKGWVAQLGASNDLAFWNYNSGWSRKIQFSSTGIVTQLGELVASARYIKATDASVGPSAAAKASLLNGDTVGFAAVSDPANRWNVIGAKSKTEMMGIVSSVANQILTFELYLNGASAVTLTTPARTFGTNTPWRLVIKQTTLVTGTSGTVRVMMRFYCTADNANATSSCYATEVTLAGINLASAQTWDVVCTIPNNASNRITCQDVEKIG